MQKDVVVTPPEVAPGGVVSVERSGDDPLSFFLNCTIRDTGNNLLQWSLIDPTGDFDLNLKDTYGALQLESCDDLTCLEPATLRFDITNGSSDPVTITQFSDFIAAVDLSGNIKGGPRDLINALSSQVIAGMSSIAVEHVFLFDYCSQTMELEVFVDTAECSATDSLTITRPP